MGYQLMLPPSKELVSPFASITVHLSRNSSKSPQVELANEGAKLDLMGKVSGNDFFREAVVVIDDEFESTGRPEYHKIQIESKE